GRLHRGTAGPLADAVQSQVPGSRPALAAQHAVLRHPRAGDRALRLRGDADRAAARGAAARPFPAAAWAGGAVRAGTDAGLGAAGGSHVQPASGVGRPAAHPGIRGRGERRLPAAAARVADRGFLAARAEAGMGDQGAQGPVSALTCGWRGRLAAWPGLSLPQLTSASLPVAMSITNPRTAAVCGRNGLALIRATDCRRSSPRSLNASAD